MMAEARKRNPKILLSALAWTWPGWVGAGSVTSPWKDPEKATSYVIAWLKGELVQPVPFLLMIKAHSLEWVKSAVPQSSVPSS